MNKGRFILTVAVTSLLSGYAGWSYGKKTSNPISNGTIQIHGLSEEVIPLGTDVPKRLSPTMAVTKCKISKFRIDKGTENMETAVVKLGGITSREFGCLIAEAQTELEGDAPFNPLSPEVSSKRFYTPLYLSFESETPNAAMH